MCPLCVLAASGVFSCILLFMLSSFFSELQFIFDKLTLFYSNVLSLFFSFMLILLMDV